MLQDTSGFLKAAEGKSRNFCFWRTTEGTEINAHINLFSSTPQPQLTTIPVQQN